MTSVQVVNEEGRVLERTWFGMSAVHDGYMRRKCDFCGRMFSTNIEKQSHCSDACRWGVRPKPWWFEQSDGAIEKTFKWVGNPFIGNNLRPKPYAPSKGVHAHITAKARRSKSKKGKGGQQ